ncbi:hypothetical protein LIT25_28065 (plasmid) [Bacillus sp. F19]|nr:hypothetical protein LIT25_28065 [Bacillus sp. F19]
MTTQIALFGSSAFVDQVQEYTKELAEISIVPFIYKNPNEVVDQIESAKYCDVLLFSGVLPYYFARTALLTYKKPSVYISNDEYMVSISIFRLLYSEGFPLDRISIDLPDRSILLQCLHDFQLDEKNLWVIDYPFILNNEVSSSFSTKEIVCYHEQLHKQGKVDITLTSIHAVYDALLSKGIKCQKMIDPKKNILNTIHEAVVKSKLYQTEQSQVAVGYILVEAEEVEDFLAHDILLHFDSEFEGTIQYIEDGLFVFYSTRGTMEKATSFYQTYPLNHYMNNHPLITIKMGIGFGLTSNEAKRNAKIALSHAEKHQSKNIAFIVTDDERIIGPLGEKTSKEYQLKSEDKRIQEMSKKAGISVAKFNHFLHFINNLPVNRFTAEDISENFNVTRRTAERLMKKLIEQQLVIKIGEEQLHQQGRPRAIYTFRLK